MCQCLAAQNLSSVPCTSYTWTIRKSRRHTSVNACQGGCRFALVAPGYVVGVSSAVLPLPRTDSTLQVPQYHEVVCSTRSCVEARGRGGWQPTPTEGFTAPSTRRAGADDVLLAPAEEAPAPREAGVTHTRLPAPTLKESLAPAEEAPAPREAGYTEARLIAGRPLLPPICCLFG